jgi:hypothetical protein
MEAIVSDTNRSNADQLRRDIDSGATGDKVRASDPAAAPLGTDEEAAGTPTLNWRVPAALLVVAVAVVAALAMLR